VRYNYKATVAYRGAACTFTGEHESAETAETEAERFASHLLKAYDAADMPAAAIMVERFCWTCRGSGSVLVNRRPRKCPVCKGQTIAEFVSLRVVSRADTLAPCQGACCDGVERVACGRCGYAHRAAGACENPACRAA
jgi:predicted Zn-ribbon and HTH transcriptional regulator